MNSVRLAIMAGLGMLAKSAQNIHLAVVKDKTSGSKAQLLNAQIKRERKNALRLKHIVQ